MKLLEQHSCFQGTVSLYEHLSKTLDCTMKFSVFLPPQANTEQTHTEKVPWLTFLSGLTCTQDNFTTKAGAYGIAADLGLAIIAPDTSPRGETVADDDSYDLGQGAGFYINATQAPWVDHYKMESYIADELNTLVCEAFSVDTERQGIMGHSMGGHGALTLYLKYPALYKSASAFSPIVAPSQVPWGIKAFTHYLGENRNQWKKHDACELMSAESNRQHHPEILIDQGDADTFLAQQLKPELFALACQTANQSLKLRLQRGYDHSYYFIQSFVGDHLRHHHRILA